MGFIKPEKLTNTTKLPVRLVLCLDGTGDTAEGSFSAVEGAKSGGRDSIKAIFDIAAEGPVKNAETGKEAFQYVQYFEGVGTVGVSTDAGIFTRATALIDGATGRGYLDILKSVYKVCCEQLQSQDKGNEIFVFGFSRGAFISRALASFLQNVGLIKKEHLDKDEKYTKKFEELLARYVELTKQPMFGKKVVQTTMPQLLPFCIPSPRVRVLGAFDTVKTVIPLPVSNFLLHRLPNVDFLMDAPLIVDHFRHALALNEQRPLFNPDLWHSPSPTDATSYLEAWFFGFHHDIGGGDVAQGLALWPLQWILGSAAENGMELNHSDPLYEVLFKGDHATVETPHEIALKMFDMVRHHTTVKSWSLKLNEPFSLMNPQPRNYFDLGLTLKPPFVESRRFLHPSAYLVFDVSSAFRIQVYDWKYFQSFLRDRFLALPQGKVPWWEETTVETILGEVGAVQHLNVLVYGRPGTGKEEIVGKMFGAATGLTTTSIETRANLPGNNQIHIYFSTGFGRGGSDTEEGVRNFLKNPPEKIHAVWYFLNTTDKKIPESEKKFFQMDFGDAPVVVVLKNEDRLKDSIREDLVDQEVSEGTIWSSFNNIVDGKKEDIMGWGKREVKVAGKMQVLENKVKAFVQARNPTEIPVNLLKETANAFSHESLQIAQIKAQRIHVKPKIALATEEAIRAYTIWHVFRFQSERKVPFARNKSFSAVSGKLSMVLMEPVLATFNVRFSGDADIIEKSMGDAWEELEGHTEGLWDATLKGGEVLCCMLDTVVVLTHALTHQTEEVAKALTKKDLEEACAWYKPKQADTHKKVWEMLDDEGRPKDAGSISNLQMRVVAEVKRLGENAEGATATAKVVAAAGAAVGAVGGAVGGAAGAATGAVKGLFGRFYK